MYPEVTGGAEGGDQAKEAGEEDGRLGGKGLCCPARRGLPRPLRGEDAGGPQGRDKEEETAEEDGSPWGEGVPQWCGYGGRQGRAEARPKDAQDGEEEGEEVGQVAGPGGHASPLAGGAVGRQGPGWEEVRVNDFRIFVCVVCVVSYGIAVVWWCHVVLYGVHVVLSCGVVHVMLSCGGVHVVFYLGFQILGCNNCCR